MPNEEKPRLFGLLAGGQPGEAATATSRRISNTIAVQLGARAIGMAIALATVPIMARSLEPDGLGVFTAGLAFVGIFGSITELGLTNAALQRMAAEPERESAWLGALAGLRAMLSLVVTAICIVSIPLLLSAEDEARLVTLILALSILPQSTGSLMSVFQSRLRAGLPQSLTVAQNFLWLGTVIAIAVLGAGAVGFAIGYLLVAVALALMQVVVTRRLVSVAWRQGWSLWVPLLRVALPLGIAAMMILLYYRVDAVLLLELDGPDEAGIYAAAYRFLDPLTALPALVMAAFFPVLSAVYAQNPTRAQHLVQRCAEAMWILTLPFLAVTLALSEPIVALLFGEAYERSAHLLPILMAALVSIGFGTLAGFLAPILGLQWRLALYSTIGALANIALNLVLIPRYGAYGSASATLVTEVITMMLMFATALHALRMRLKLGRFAATLGAAAGLWVAAAALRPVGLLPALVGGALAYLTLLVLFRVVRRDELRSLRAPRL